MVDCRSNSSPAQSPTRADSNSSSVTWDFGDSSDEDNLRKGREDGQKIYGLGGTDGAIERVSGFQRSGSSISFANEDEGRLLKQE